MTKRVALYDTEAEGSLLGDLMLRPDKLPEVRGWLSPADFFNPGYARVYQTIEALWDRGAPINVVTVGDDLGPEIVVVGGRQRLLELLSSGSAAPVAAAKIVVRLATARRMHQSLAAAQTLLEEREDPSDVAQSVMSDLLACDRADSGQPDGVWSVDEFLCRPGEVRRPWAVPGLLREGWRALLVAEEGVGKSVLMSQVALCAAQGVHPFGGDRFSPVRAGLIDCENPAEHLDERVKPLSQWLSREKVYDPSRCSIWHREGGIDLCSRRSRTEFAAFIGDHRPQLVCMGPIYKMYVSTRRDDEERSREVLAFLDDMRTRFGVAFLMEHHAPKKVAGSARELTPFGSSLWLRWPEFGFSLVKGRVDGEVEVRRFRGDRMKAGWPDRLRRGDPLPWEGVWNRGMEDF